MSHTPGPWIVDEHGRGANGASIIAANGLRVVSLPKVADRPYDDKAGDARLIAAAPDLLAALKAVEFRGHGLDKCPDCAGWNASPSGETPHAHAKDCALAAAIAKAEGR